MVIATWPAVHGGLGYNLQSAQPPRHTGWPGFTAPERGTARCRYDARVCRRLERPGAPSAPRGGPGAPTCALLQSARLPRARAIEVGGCWSSEAARFARLLARCRARAAPALVCARGERWDVWAHYGPRHYTPLSTWHTPLATWQEPERLQISTCCRHGFHDTCTRTNNMYNCQATAFTCMPRFPFSAHNDVRNIPASVRSQFSTPPWLAWL